MKPFSVAIEDLLNVTTIKTWGISWIRTEEGFGLILNGTFKCWNISLNKNKTNLHFSYIKIN
jgi:hypothetical protein